MHVFNYKVNRFITTKNNMQSWIDPGPKDRSIYHFIGIIAKIRIRPILLLNNIPLMLFPDFDNCTMVT